MGARYVVDAGALALYFVGDEEARRYISEIIGGEAEGYICEVNLAELYYKTAEKLASRQPTLGTSRLGALL